MKKRFLALTVGLLLLVQLVAAQSKTLHVSIANLPHHTVAIGYMHGDEFVLCDSVMTGSIMQTDRPVKRITWDFPADAQRGMYRIVFGQTTYARVMNKPPQQLDLIFNGEDIRLQTDFNAPTDSLKVFSSEENRVWFSFLKKEKEFRENLKELEMEVNYYQEKLSGPGAKSEGEGFAEAEQKMASVANSYNLLQMEREAFIKNTVDENSHLFAARVINLYREPFRDGYLSAPERKVSWQKEYFRFIDFSDETLINTPVLTDKVFNFLTTYNKREFTKAQREDAYIPAVDAVMAAVEESAEKGGAVYEFVLDYLVDGFERLGMSKVLTWLADNYAAALCTTEEKTTLLRKLQAQKMVAGTVVPDFTLNNLNGHPVTLSRDLKRRNLIVFWASWCPHCSSMLPGIKSLVSRESDLEVFAISLDKSASDWQQAVAEAGVEQFKNLSDLKEWEGEAAEDYNIYATPTLFLVDSNRKIIARPATLEELSEILSGS